MQSLQGFGVRGQSLAIDLEIALVHDHGASIDGRRHRWREGRAPVSELMYGVVVQIIKEFQSVITHYVGLLRDRCRNYAAVDPVKRLRIVVERNNRRLPFPVEPVQRFGGARTTCRLQANDSV